MPAISGIQLREQNNCYYFIIDNFSDEFKALIRKQLSSVWYGFADVEELPEIHSYKRTLSSFLDRYKDKSEDTKKGMIGELLAHILIGEYLNHMTSLSVLKNKEDRSIKKGFDIIYQDNSTAFLWYSEVKSGHRGVANESSTEYNTILLDRSYDGITDMFASKRDSLWESALIDVKLTIADTKKKINIAKLLDSDSPIHGDDSKKNIVLISVLYHCPTEPVEFDSIEAFLKKVIAEQKYENAIAISIQKKLFDKVAEFLTGEAAL